MRTCRQGSGGGRCRRLACLRSQPVRDSENQLHWGRREREGDEPRQRSSRRAKQRQRSAGLRCEASTASQARGMRRPCSRSCGEGGTLCGEGWSRRLRGPKREASLCEGRSLACSNVQKRECAPLQRGTGSPAVPGSNQSSQHCSFKGGREERTSVEDLLVLDVKVSKRNKDIEVDRRRPILPLLNSHRQVRDDMTSNLRLLLELDRKLQRRSLPERLDLQLRLLRLGRRSEGEVGRIEVTFDVSGTSDGPGCLGASLECRLGFVRVEPGVPLANEEVDGGNLDVRSQLPSGVVFVLEPGVEDFERRVSDAGGSELREKRTRLLESDVVREVEGEVVTRRKASAS